MPTLVYAVEQPDLPPFSMSDRFRHEITYFAVPRGEPDIPKMGAGEYWIRRDDALKIYDDGVIVLVSPLDSASRTEIELSEEQEAWLEWMNQHEIEHVRLA